MLFNYMLFSQGFYQNAIITRVSKALYKNVLKS